MSHQAANAQPVERCRLKACRYRNERREAAADAVPGERHVAVGQDQPADGLRLRARLRHEIERRVEDGVAGCGHGREAGKDRAQLVRPLVRNHQLARRLVQVGDRVQSAVRHLGETHEPRGQAPQKVVRRVVRVDAEGRELSCVELRHDGEVPVGSA